MKSPDCAAHRGFEVDAEAHGTGPHVLRDRALAGTRSTSSPGSQPKASLSLSSVAKSTRSVALVHSRLIVAKATPERRDSSLWLIPSLCTSSRRRNRVARVIPSHIAEPRCRQDTSPGCPKLQRVVLCRKSYST